MVDATELASIAISSRNREPPSGVTQVCSAVCFDAHGNDLGDVTTGTVFSVDGTGTCTDNACEIGRASCRERTYTAGTFTEIAKLKVDATEIASITLSPKNAEIPADRTQVYTAGGRDD